MSWIVAAVSVGALTAGGKAIEANQAKQKNKGYIADAYRTASQKLNLEHAGARESEAEGANARGLANDGAVTANPIPTAMVNGLMTATGPAPTTIGGQERADAEVQMGLETKDLSQQDTRANQENASQYTNALIGAGESGIQAGESVYTGGTDFAAGRNAAAAADAARATTAAIGAGNAPLASPTFTPTAAPTAAPPTSPDVSSASNPIHDSLLSGMSWGGIHPNLPLGSPSSAWYTGSKPKIAQPGETAGAFNAD